MRYKWVRGSEAEVHSQELGERTAFLATGVNTDGRVSIYDSKLPEGNGAPWHYHELDDEIFYIISGRVEFGVEKEAFKAGAGDLVLAGPGVRRRLKALEETAHGRR